MCSVGRIEKGSEGRENQRPPERHNAEQKMKLEKNDINIHKKGPLTHIYIHIRNGNHTRATLSDNPTA